MAGPFSYMLTPSAGSRLEGWTAYRGSKFHIQYAYGSGGSCPAKDFYDSLDRSDQAKVMALFKWMGGHGNIRNEEKFKKVQGRLFEFKSFRIRIICAFQPGGRLLLLRGVLKKKDRHDRADIEAAERTLREHLDYVRRQAQ